MTKPIEFTAEQRAEIVLLYNGDLEAGVRPVGSRTIGKRFGRSDATILRVLRQEGVQIRRGGRGIQFTPKMECEAERLYVEEDWTKRAIGKYFGCGHQKIARILAKRNVANRKPGGRKITPLPSGDLIQFETAKAYRDGFTNGWGAALSKLRPPRYDRIWEAARRHLFVLVRWSEQGVGEVPPVCLGMK